MTLAEILRILMSSEPDAWDALPERPTAAGHSNRVVYRADVLLSIEWGLVLNDDFSEAWVPTLPSGKVTSSLVDVIYAGGKVHERTIVNLDGDHSIVPMPETYKGPDGSVGYRFKASEVNLARTLHALSGAGLYDFDRYLTSTGLAIEDDLPKPSIR